jgi:outer membrane protein assembly factor BamB
MITDTRYATTAAAADGLVYVGAPSQTVIALDARNGAQRWQAHLDVASPFDKFPTFVWVEADGKVYVVSGNQSGNAIYAFDAATGAQRWRIHTGTDNLSTPTVANGVVYFGSYDDHVYALDGATGALRWRFQTQDRVLTAPTVANGVVYVSATESDHYVYALDAATGKLRWRFETGGVFFAPVVAGGSAYVGSNDGFFYALST